MKKLFMETTKIPADQTVAEIQRILGRYGASAIMTEYDKGEVTSLTFKIMVKDDKWIPFRLPCRCEPIQAVLFSRRKRTTCRSSDIPAQAKRVAWRQILRWVEAQMALVETDMVKVQEVFMPYIQVGIDGQTAYEKFEQKGLALLEDKTR